MKRFLIYTFFFLLGTYEVIAQENNNEKRLHFVYIDHEVTTPTKVLNERMTQRFYDVGEFKDREALVLYLSNGRRSPVAFVNLKDYLTKAQLERLSISGQSRDTEEAFKSVLETMNNANSHDVEPLIDIDNIINLFEGLHVFNDNGKLNFKVLRLDFYIGPKFWLLRNNEKIISRLYALLYHGLQEDDKEKITFNIFKPKGTQLDYPDGKPFGDANLNGINEKLQIMDY